MDVAEYEYVDTIPPSEPLNFRKHSVQHGVQAHHLGEIVGNSLVHGASLSVWGGEEADWSKPVDLSDEYSWTVQGEEGEAGLASRLEQDYQDIDYTSGSLVSFHTSLSR